MKKILETLSINNKTVKRLYGNQFIVSMLGIMILFASSNNDALLWFASFFTIGIYMFLTYNLMWETGAKKASKNLNVSVKSAQNENMKEGLTIILAGTLVNFIGAVAYLIAKIYVVASNITTNATDDMGVFIGNIIWTVLRFIHAAYWGIEALLFPNPNVGLTYDEIVEFAPLLTPPYYFFLTLLPMILVGTYAYILGASEVSILKKMGFNVKTRLNTDINYRNKKK